MMDETKRECDFCHTKEFEAWRGSHGLQGLRCKNRCIASYVIFTEVMMLAGFPKEIDNRKEKEKVRYGKHYRKN